MTKPVSLTVHYQWDRKAKFYIDFIVEGDWVPYSPAGRTRSGDAYPSEGGYIDDVGIYLVVEGRKIEVSAILNDETIDNICALAESQCMRED